MKGLNEDEVYAMVEKIISTKYARQIGSSHFQGKILTAVAQPAPLVGYLCTISRTGETVSDGSTYVAALPGYTPTVGQIVQCSWLDNHTGLILWPISS